jgi:hypothetical protein
MDASISLFDCTNELVFRMALIVVSILGNNSGNSKVTLKGDRVCYLVSVSSSTKGTYFPDHLSN